MDEVCSDFDFQGFTGTEEVTGDATIKEISDIHRDILLSFVKRHQPLENVDDTQWKSLTQELHASSGPVIPWDSWKNVLLNWKAQAAQRKLTLCIYDTSDPNLPVPSLSEADVKLLLALGELKAEDKMNESLTGWDTSTDVIKKTSTDQTYKEPEDNSSLFNTLAIHLRSAAEDNQQTGQLCSRLRYVINHLDQILSDIVQKGVS